MRITINKDEVLGIINGVLGTSSAGWGKDCSIIVDQTLEEIVKNEDENEDNDNSMFAMPLSRNKKQSAIRSILEKGKYSMEKM